MPQVNGIALGASPAPQSDICPSMYRLISGLLRDGYKVNAYRYILKRDVARAAAQLSEDILCVHDAGRYQDLTKTTNRENIRIPLTASIIRERGPGHQCVWGHCAGTFLHLLR